MMRRNGKKRMWSDICGGGLKSGKGSFLEASLQNNINNIYIFIFIQNNINLLLRILCEYYEIVDLRMK